MLIIMQRTIFGILNLDLPEDRQTLLSFFHALSDQYCAHMVVFYCFSQAFGKAEFFLHRQFTTRGYIVEFDKREEPLLNDPTGTSCRGTSGSDPSAYGLVPIIRNQAPGCRSRGLCR